MERITNICCVVLCISCMALGDILIKSLPNGKIRGQEGTTAKGTTYLKFLGIPYAEAPIEHLRFQPPKEAKNWNGILNATSDKKICYQFGDSPGLIQDEDCLFINVYAPKRKCNNCEQSAVMFWIHGGGLVNGHSADTLYGPEYFMDYDVVVVTFNYRLGVFGCLSTGDLVLPGNIALKDQVFALKWVQTNIHIFGGDPNKVTLFGESSGAASVSHLILSKHTKGLYRGAISQSGSALSIFAFERDPKKMAYAIAKVIDNTFEPSKNNSEDLKQMFMKTPANVLKNVTETVAPSLTTFWNFSFGVVLEPEHNGALLTENMFKLMKEGRYNRVPHIIGFTSEEDLPFAQDDEFNDTRKGWNVDVTELVPHDLNIIDVKTKQEVGEIIKNYYVGNGTFLDNTTATIKFSTEGTVLSSIKEAKLKSEFSNIYFYQFSYHGLLGQNNFSLEGLEKVGHFEDIFYLFKMEEIDLKDYPESDILTHNRLLKMWTNFAKTLNPTPERDNLLENITWPLFSSKQHLNSYLDIRDHLTIKKDPRDEGFKFWDFLYMKYGVPPFNTY